MTCTLREVTRQLAKAAEDPAMVRLAEGWARELSGLQRHVRLGFVVDKRTKHEHMLPQVEYLGCARMTSPLGRKHRLVGRGEAGVSCDEDGIALGGVRLVRASRTVGNARYCETRSPAEIDQILRAAYGPQPDGVASRVHRGLCRAAAWIEAGDLGRAGVETVGLGLPDLGSVSMAKLVEIADLEKGGDAWRNEPRVPAGQGGGGQWTADGAGSPMADVKPVGNEAASTSDGANLYSFHPLDNGLLVHVNTAAVAVGDLARRRMWSCRREPCV